MPVTIVIEKSAIAPARWSKRSIKGVVRAAAAPKNDKASRLRGRRKIQPRIGDGPGLACEDPLRHGEARLHDHVGAAWTGGRRRAQRRAGGRGRRGGQAVPRDGDRPGPYVAHDVMRMGGESLVGLNAAVREAAGVQAGDTVAVELALDTAPREVDVPEALAAALER